MIDLFASADALHVRCRNSAREAGMAQRSLISSVPALSACCFLPISL
ncbi:hypothetical protein K7957_15685 [Sphingomonas yunnanensis]|nr:hypothetical protein [Sphingomonas yunnanensis]MBY9064380.1 hypothetical protein [Sphingomonas yunnanensis]